MNWYLFFFAGFVGVTAGVLFRRSQPTRVELWVIVLARVAVALFLALVIPAGEGGPPASNAALGALVVSEMGRGLEVIVSSLLDRWLVQREARKWLAN